MHLFASPISTTCFYSYYDYVLYTSDAMTVVEAVSFFGVWQMWRC